MYTIEEGEDISIQNEESDGDDIENAKSKKQIKRVKEQRKGFNDKFVFEAEDEDTGMTIESIMESLHFKKHIERTSLDHKIAEVRKARMIKKAHFNETKALKDDNKEKPTVTKQDVNAESDSESETTVLKMDKIRIKSKRKIKHDDDLEEEIRQNIKEKKVKLTIEGDISDEEFFASAPQWNPELSFQDMNLSRPILKGISALNYVTPTPIQQATIPVALLGKDVSACAATGTGKTAAFMLPVLERLLFKPRFAPVTRVLCLVPTRELAIQVHAISRQLAQFTDVQTCLAAGGLDLKSQEAALRQGPDVLIATPGRLIDHLHNTPSFQLESVEILILDEADRMLDEFFAEQMMEIIKLCSSNRQTMLFSATMPEKVNEFAAVALKKPVKLFVNSNTDVAPCLRQEFVRIRPNKEGDREAIVSALCSRTFVTSTLIFTQTKKQAHRMHIVLGLLGLKVAELHGDLNQAQRLQGLEKFKNAEVDILVCTDLAARGLDISNVKTVINFTMPNTLKHYVHRVGRTARAGKTGRSVSLVGESERKMLKEIVKLAKNPVRSRLVPPAVIERYKAKLEELDRGVGDVLRMEIEEKEMMKSEAQISKGQRILQKKPSDLPTEKRNWFQTKIERETKRAECMLGMHSEAKPGRKGKKGKQNYITPPKNAEERAAKELEKVQAFQMREKKRQRKPKRIRACAENVIHEKPKLKKKKSSSFDSELTNTSTRAVKNFRSNPSYDERKKFGIAKKQRHKNTNFKGRGKK